MIVIYLCLLGIVWAETLETETITLTMVSIPQFPFQAEKPFDMVVGTNARKGVLSKSIIDTMVIHIPNTEGVGESAVFDFGFKDSIDKEFSGVFMRIPSWEKNVENGTITARIFFTKFANGKSLEVYHISVDTSKERRNALKNLKLAKQVYQAKINLLISSTIEMFVNSISGSVVELSTEEVHLVTCRNPNGIAGQKPSLTGLNITTKVNVARNEISAKFRVVPADHGKNLTCKTGTEEKRITLKVLHAPSRIALWPRNVETVSAGSSVLCTKGDGYPTPMTSWKFVDGPAGAADFYTMSHDKQSIYFNRKTPLRTKWTFQCSAWNTIKGTRHYFNQTVTLNIDYVNQNESSSPGNDTEEHNVKWDKWEIKDKYNKKQLITMKKVVYKHSKDIEKLKKNFDKQNKEITRLKAAVSMGKLEISRLKSQLKRVDDAQNAQNMKYVKLKRYVDERFESRRDPWMKFTSDAPQKQPKEGPILKQRIMRPVIWKVDDVLKLRKKRRVIRSKRFFLNYPDREMTMVLDFRSHQALRLSLHMFPLRRFEGRDSIKGSFTITISDAENSSSKVTAERSFQIGSELLQIDIIFHYLDLMKFDVLQNDEITIRLAGFWEA